MVSAIKPQAIPTRKANAALKAMRKDMPIPMVVDRPDVIRIVRVDGKATCLMKL